MDVFMPVLKLVWEKTRLVDARRMKREKYPEGIKEYRDIPYLDDGDMYHLLDIYMPADAGTSLPVMIDIHGGGWMYGTKEINRCGTGLYCCKYKLSPCRKGSFQRTDYGYFLCLRLDRRKP